MRKDRSFNQMREISFEKNVNIHADGSCLVKFGNTHVLCLATIDEKVPHWLKNTGKGWVTAEYGMLPRSTNTRMDREAAKGKQSGRTQEIQRLVGRSLRSIVARQRTCVLPNFTKHEPSAWIFTSFSNEISRI